jgi:hypothetical protein
MRCPIRFLLSASCVLSVLQISGFGARADESDRVGITAAPHAPNDAWPDATNTGVPRGVTLKSNGHLWISKPGTVVSGLDIEGTVDIDAANVTLMNSRIRGARYAVVLIKQGTQGVVVQDCEIDGIGSGNDGSSGIQGGGTFRRNNIYHVENGFALNASSIIEDNYVHDLLASGSPHYDGIQIDGEVSDVTIRHNTVINQYTQTSAVMIDNYFGPISNISVDNNVLIGGGYTVYSSAQFDGGPVTGVSFTNNRLGQGKWGYASIVKNTPVWRGNVDHATGRALGAR